VKKLITLPVKHAGLLMAVLLATSAQAKEPFVGAWSTGSSVSGVMFLSEPGEGPSGWWDTLNSPGVAQCGMSSASVERRGHIRCSSCTMGGYLGPPYAGMF